MSEQNKSPTQAAAEPPQSPQAQVYTVQQPGVAPYAPYGSYYPYAAPPTDANGHVDPNAAAAAPTYMMAFPAPPPGMIYAYPTAQGYPTMPFAPGMALPAALSRPKRKQVKTACTNCAAACKRCDDARPCERCCKYRLEDTCVDGQRKERKKGVKRGPYKRKGKDDDDSPEQTYEDLPPEQAQAPTTPPPPQPSASFYPSYYYPPPGFVSFDGQPIQADANGQPVMHPQYYPLHPAYAPFAAYPASAAYPMMSPGPMAPMAPQPEPSSDGGNPAPAPAPVAEASPPKSNGSNGSNKDNNDHDRDSQGDSPPRRKRQRHAANAGADGKDDNGSSKRAGKRPAAQETTTTDAEPPGTSV